MLQDDAYLKLGTSVGKFGSWRKMEEQYHSLLETGVRCRSILVFEATLGDPHKYLTGIL